MFESISFLFLFAMAFFTWALLCFQHAVEIQRRAASDYHVEIYTERPGITFEPQLCHKPLEPSLPTGTFDFAMSFGVILALTICMSKLLQVAERQAKNYLKGRETLKPAIGVETRSLTGDLPEEQKLLLCQQNQVNQLNQATLDPVVVEENADLREQLCILQSHCLEMRELLHELRLSKSSSSQGSAHSGDNLLSVEHSEESMMIWKGADSIAEPMSASSQPRYRNPEPVPLSSGTAHPSQNIYITNSHIHIGGPVFCSEKNASIELCRLASMYARKQSEFLQVWGKYITGPKERPMIAGMRCNNILL